MARRYDIDLDSLWMQSRAFRFSGRLPTVKRSERPTRVVPFCVLGPKEQTSHGELAFGPDHVVFGSRHDDGTLSIPVLTAHTSTWKAMDQRLNRAIHTVLGEAASCSVDGVYEVMVQDDFVVTLRPIDDVAQGRAGILLSALLECLPEGAPDLAVIEQTVAEASALLPLGEIVIGAPHDPDAEDQGALDLSYTVFADHVVFDGERAAEVLRQGVSLAHHLRELVDSFGLGGALLAALRPLPGEAGASRHIPAIDQVGQPLPTVSSDLADLGSRLRRLNARYFLVDRQALRRQVLRYLAAIGCNLGPAAADENTILFSHRGVCVRMDLVADPVDCVNLQVAICDGVRLTDALMRTLLPFFQSQVMGSLVALPNAADPELRDIIFGDTVLAGELDLDELVLSMANVLLTAMTLRETVSIVAGIDPTQTCGDAELPSLAPLFSYLEARRSRSSSPVDFESAGELRHRLDSCMRQLGLWPRLGGGRNIGFRHDGVTVELVLRQDGGDTFVTFRAILLERLDTGPISLIRWLMTQTGFAQIGGFKIVEGGLLAYEDTVLGNSIDLNEFAHTLESVAAAATTAQRALLAEPSLGLGPDNLPRERSTPAVEEFVELYRQSTDPVERCKAIQVLTLLGASARHVAIDAVLDPHPVVADFAAASLIASEQSLAAEPDVRKGAVVCLTDILEAPRYSDPTRQRVLRTLAGLLDFDRADSPGPELREAGRRIVELSINPRESVALRLSAIAVLPVLGTDDALDAILQLIEAPFLPTTEAALSALAAFELQTDEARERARLLLGAWMASGSDIPAHIVDLCDQLRVEIPAERLTQDAIAVPPPLQPPGPVALVLARRAHEDPAAADRLRSMLESSRGELRHQAIRAVESAALVSFVPDVIKALKTEVDPYLVRKLLILLALLGGGGFAAHEVLERYVNDDHLRVRALLALRPGRRG